MKKILHRCSWLARSLVASLSRLGNWSAKTLAVQSPSPHQIPIGKSDTRVSPRRVAPTRAEALYRWQIR